MKNYKIIKNKIELESLELSSLTTKIKDGTHSSFKDSNNKDSKILYSAKNIKNSNIIEGKNERRISLEDYKKIVNNGFPKKGDILLTIVGTIGESMIWNKEHSEAFQRSVAFIRCNNLIIPEYLKYAFKSNYLKNDISRRIKVGAQPGIYLKDLAKLKIKITTISQQKRIAEVLSKQESIINKTKDLIKQLDKRNTFMLDELLSGRLRIKEENGKMEFYKNPDDNWQTVLMNRDKVKIPKDYSNIKIEGNYSDLGKSKIKAKSCNLEGKYPFFNCSVNQTLRSDNYIHDRESLYLSTGGKPAIHYYNGKASYSTDVWSISFNKDEILNKFIYLFFYNNMSLLEQSFKGAGLKHLSKKDFQNIEIILPSKIDQENIIEIYQKINNEKEKYEELLIEEQKRFDFLLEELMSGRLRIEE